MASNITFCAQGQPAVLGPMNIAGAELAKAAHRQDGGGRGERALAIALGRVLVSRCHCLEKSGVTKTVFKGRVNVINQ